MGSIAVEGLSARVVKAYPLAKASAVSENAIDIKAESATAN